MSKYGFSFSWKRALGISAAKQRFARQTGIPTTQSGLVETLIKFLFMMAFPDFPISPSGNPIIDFFIKHFASLPKSPDGTYAKFFLIIEYPRLNKSDAIF